MTSISPRTSGIFPASAIVQGSQVIIHSVDRAVNTTFICTVTNAVGTGHAEQLVLVRGEWVSGAACDDRVCFPGVGVALEEAVPPAGGGIQTRLNDGRGVWCGFLSCPRIGVTG